MRMELGFKTGAEKQPVDWFPHSAVFNGLQGTLKSDHCWAWTKKSTFGRIKSKSGLQIQTTGPFKKLKKNENETYYNFTENEIFQFHDIWNKFQFVF